LATVVSGANSVVCITMPATCAAVTAEAGAGLTLLVPAAPIQTMT
jgi:hypothetical protein